MVSDLARRRTVNQAVGIRAAFWNGPKHHVDETVKNNSASFSDGLTKANRKKRRKNSAFHWLYFQSKKIESTISTALFIACLIWIWFSRFMCCHCHSSRVSTCNLCCLPPLSLAYLPMTSLSVGVHCYQGAVIIRISLPKSGKVRLHLWKDLQWLPYLSYFQIPLWPYIPPCVET